MKKLFFILLLLFGDQSISAAEPLVPAALKTCHEHPYLTIFLGLNLLSSDASHTLRYILGSWWLDYYGNKVIPASIRKHENSFVAAAAQNAGLTSVMAYIFSCDSEYVKRHPFIMLCGSMSWLSAWAEVYERHY